MALKNLESSETDTVLLTLFQNIEMASQSLDQIFLHWLHQCA